MIEDVIQIIGCGQCGTRLGLKFERFNVDTFYINSDEHDIRGTFIDPKKLLLLGIDGTGGKPSVGEELLKNNWKDVEIFINNNIDPQKLTLVVGGLGGGTGGSALPTVLEYLIHKKISTGCLATLPPRIQGMLPSNNALRTLKALMELKINMFILADNEYLITKKGIGDDWWDEVNNTIAVEVKSIFDLLRVGKISQKGIGSIDKAEVLRILQYGNGFVDIRTKYFTHSDFKTIEEGQKNKVLDSLFVSSLVEGYQYKTTLAYLVGVDVPKKKIFTKEAKEIFDIVKKTCGSAISRLGMFSDPLLDDVIRVTMVNAGLKLPKILNTRINNLKRDEQRFMEKKEKKDDLNLSELTEGILD